MAVESLSDVEDCIAYLVVDERVAWELEVGDLDWQILECVSCQVVERDVDKELAAVQRELK